jgi:hypothetical protein
MEQADTAWYTAPDAQQKSVNKSTTMASAGTGKVDLKLIMWEK